MKTRKLVEIMSALRIVEFGDAGSAPIDQLHSLVRTEEFDKTSLKVTSNWLTSRKDFPWCPPPVLVADGENKRSDISTFEGCHTWTLKNNSLRMIVWDGDFLSGSPTSRRCEFIVTGPRKTILEVFDAQLRPVLENKLMYHIIEKRKKELEAIETAAYSRIEKALFE